MIARIGMKSFPRHEGYRDSYRLARSHIIRPDRQQMLDVNADLSGNVADDLQPYSHEAALAQLWSFVQEEGLEDTYAESEAYIAHLENYACTEEGDLATGSQDVPSLGSGTCADHIPPLPERGFSALWLVGVAGATLAVYVVCRLYHAKRKR